MTRRIEEVGQFKCDLRVLVATNGAGDASGGISCRLLRAFSAVPKTLVPRRPLHAIVRTPTRSHPASISHSSPDRIGESHVPVRAVVG